MTSQFQFDHFLEAQENVFVNVISELRSGHKSTHWMWYIFPQHVGLGQSKTAKDFGLESLEEAKAYLAHPILGKRLVQCTALVLDHSGRRLDSIFIFPDNYKFRSCMTLFELTNSERTEFRAALDEYCGGNPDDKTLALLGSDD